jgi:nicotinamidase-related amidase
MSQAYPGWVPERSIGHAWKACVPQGTEGSNPSPSAIPSERRVYSLVLDRLEARRNQVPRLRSFQKGIDPEVDSYSGFFDNGRRRSTGLGDFLKKQNVTALYVAGLATDYCVKFTVLDAKALGFPTVLIDDACRGVERQAGDVARAIDEMAAAGVTIGHGFQL